MDFQELIVRIGNVLLVLLPVLLWCAFWLWAVNWKKAWPVLRQGGWAPLVLLIVMAAVVWSRIQRTDWPLFEGVTLPNFWWQFAGVLFLTALAFFSGWLQGVLHQTPFEVAVEPPPAEPGHHHGHH